jgi:hypothetical protein
MLTAPRADPGNRSVFDPFAFNESADNELLLRTLPDL